MLKKRVRFQEKQERHQEQLQLEYEEPLLGRGDRCAPVGHWAKPRSMNVVVY